MKDSPSPLMNCERQRRWRRIPSEYGFTLIQVCVLLTVAALTMVVVLPSSQTNLTAANVTTAKLNAILLALRQYEEHTGMLPCPADASQPIGGTTYGVIRPITAPAARPPPTSWTSRTTSPSAWCRCGRWDYQMTTRWMRSAATSPTGWTPTRPVAGARPPTPARLSSPTTGRPPTASPRWWATGRTATAHGCRSRVPPARR